MGSSPGPANGHELDGDDTSCHTRIVGFSPASRREALLYELCTKGGFCNRLNADDLVDGLSRQDIVRMVFVAEGFGADPAMWERRLREPVERMIDEWLFEPNGRGAKSGLPR